ncbi:hypothetical protein OAG1_20390 [Agarivorans sp. OAG1]|uniref:hypothetical protein n=1 Tax=Agarivorans sp. OAG1 TaxID=3082387 RepID=UPI002B27F9EF|nr:hypothetical protein OAG1_20390 [Agarivorans sp. OAG1]
MDAQDDIERQIKELERDKRLEEIRQLRASAKTRWITPTALAALLPLLAGFGIWIVGELKQYNEGYKALAERDALRREKDALQQQKDSLNIEVSTLLQLKAHYADEAERLQRDTAAKQEAIDKTYLRGVFTSAEALYALDHIKGMGPPLDENTLERVRGEIKQLPNETAHIVDDVLQRYEMSLVVIGISRDVISEFENTLKLIPASEWTRELQSMPTGAIVPDRKIMILQKGDQQQYYDVTEERFLNIEEAEHAR